MTVNSLIDQIYERLFRRIKKHELRWIFSFLIDEINKSISEGKTLKIKNLGTFKVRFKKSRKVKVPNKKEEHRTKEHYSVQFIPSKTLKVSAHEYSSPARSR